MKFILIALVFFAVSAEGQTNKSIQEKFEMKEYYLVFLKKGPIRNQDSVTTAGINKEHLAYLTKMYDEDKMSLCGPLMNDNEIRGVCIYHVSTAEEAQKLAEADPAVKSGRLIVEVHPWYSAKGMILK